MCRPTRRPATTSLNRRMGRTLRRSARPAPARHRFPWEACRSQHEVLFRDQRLQFEGDVRPSRISPTPPRPARPSVLDFSSGFGQSASGVLTYNGSAKINGTSAQLTDSGSNEAGSVFSTNAVDVTKFSNQFTFQLTNAERGRLYVHDPGRWGRPPWALPAADWAMGRSPADVGSPRAWQSSSTCSATRAKAPIRPASTPNGASPTTPAIDLTSTGINLHSGDVFQVVMSYDGTTLNVTITDTVTHATASQSLHGQYPASGRQHTGLRRLHRRNRWLDRPCRTS